MRLFHVTSSFRRDTFKSPTRMTALPVSRRTSAMRSRSRARKRTFISARPPPDPAAGTYTLKSTKVECSVMMHRPSSSSSASLIASESARIVSPTRAKVATPLNPTGLFLPRTTDEPGLHRAQNVSNPGSSAPSAAGSFVSRELTSFASWRHNMSMWWPSRKAVRVPCFSRMSFTVVGHEATFQLTMCKRSLTSSEAGALAPAPLSTRPPLSEASALAAPAPLSGSLDDASAAAAVGDEHSIPGHTPTRPAPDHWLSLSRSPPLQPLTLLHKQSAPSRPRLFAQP
mmetsp:Transcript_29702/g.96754  ORF Transcript_29702/g.96754 Transcript_29702/m.96754 type:complete len:285 (-) Transcript_29702:309-1163(-)